MGSWFLRFSASIKKIFLRIIERCLGNHAVSSSSLCLVRQSELSSFSTSAMKNVSPSSSISLQSTNIWAIDIQHACYFSRSIKRNHNWVTCRVTSNVTFELMHVVYTLNGVCRNCSSAYTTTDRNTQCTHAGLPWNGPRTNSSPH